jgi:membrane protease YdiL (CAAX protease family)
MTLQELEPTGVPAQPEEPWGWGALVLVVVVGTALSAVLLAAGAAGYALLLALESRGTVPRHVLADTLSGWGMSTQTAVLAASGGAIYGAFLLAVWLVVGRQRGGWDSLGLRRPSLNALALVVPVYVATLFVAGIATALEAALLFHGHFTNPQTTIIAGAGANRTVGDFLALYAVIALLGPVVEELVFRGLLFELFRRSLPVWAAATLSALLFALAHGIPVLLPALFVIGVALALLYNYTRSLYTSMALHILVNSVALFSLLATR